MSTTYAKLCKSDLKGVTRETKDLILIAMRTEGCEGRKTRNGHIQLKFNGVVTVLGGTNSDIRSAKNDRARLKRLGLVS